MISSTTCTKNGWIWYIMKQVKIWSSMSAFHLRLLFLASSIQLASKSCICVFIFDTRIANWSTTLWVDDSNPLIHHPAPHHRYIRTKGIMKTFHIIEELISNKEGSKRSFLRGMHDVSQDTCAHFIMLRWPKQSQKFRARITFFITNPFHFMFS